VPTDDSAEVGREVPHEKTITLSADDVAMLAEGDVVGPWIINGEQRYIELDGWEVDDVEVSTDE